MRKLVVPNSFFFEAAETLREGRSVRLHVDGQSMYPFIHGGKDERQLYDTSFHRYERRHVSDVRRR